ncbi:MAG: HDIG domain-containing protein [Bacteroidales bacterium]|nr:HDIG domain-containing protein [Bacteroidales bacterium]MCF8389738.1 HDIG domain-containing protein [Bacteroidales bacterium]
MEREEAFKLLKEYVKSEKMIIHSLSSEAVLRSIARKTGKDEDKYGLAGLLHDIDVEITNADPYTHGIKCIEILEEKGVDPDIIDAIAMHNEVASGKERVTEFQHALAAGETITGLIYATALIYPDKKMAIVQYKSVTKRMKQKAFAASVSRENIMECEKIGISLDDFVRLSVDAMREISDDIGL